MILCLGNRIKLIKSKNKQTNKITLKLLQYAELMKSGK